MSRRFIFNVAVAGAGAIIVVTSQAFTPSVTGWIVFGVSLGTLALLGLVERERMRGVQGMLDLGIGALAIWSAVASVVYDGTTLTRLSLAEGIGYAALGLAGLAVHELKTERIVHSVEALPGEARNGRRSEELQTAA